MQVLQHELGNFKSFNADVLVNVDLGGFTWIDFHRALDIVEQGRLAGERAVPEIRAALEARGGIDRPIVSRSKSRRPAWCRPPRVRSTSSWMSSTWSLQPMKPMATPSR